MEGYLQQSFVNHPFFKQDSRKFEELHNNYHGKEASLAEVVARFQEIIKAQPDTFWQTLVEFLTAPETRLTYGLFENIPNHETLDKIAENLHIPSYILSLLKFLYKEHMEKMALEKKLNKLGELIDNVNTVLDS